MLLPGHSLNSHSLQKESALRSLTIRKVGVTAGIAAAVAAFSLVGASAASADTPRHGVVYPTYYDCVYAGNTYAQMGLLHGFSCPQVNGGYRLDWW
jgi:hypothetical protein